MTPVLSVRNLFRIFGTACSRCFDGNDEICGNKCPWCGAIVACKNISFDLYPEEVLGIVGESGSGKSTLLKILYFEEEPTSGEMFIHLTKRNACFPGEAFMGSVDAANVLSLNSYQKRLFRNHYMGMVYQNPFLGLRMHISAGGNIAEKLFMAGFRNIAKIRERAIYLLEKTEVPGNRLDESPASFSGGMQQRVQIAKALSNVPMLLFLDEPTTGLDLSVQARVLDLIKSLQKEMRLATIVVSHDLGIIRHLTTRTMVMKDGEIVEAGLTDQVLEDPQHPFTQLLVCSTL